MHPKKTALENEVARRDAIAAMTDEEYEQHVAAKLARFGDKAGKHGPLANVLVPTMVRLPRDTNLRVQQLARRLGMRRAPFLAQLAEVASWCHEDDWYRAVAAFQAAFKKRAPSELI